MKHLVFLAELYVLVAALVVPTSLFAADQPAPAAPAAAPTTTAPGRHHAGTHPDHGPRRAGPGPGANRHHDGARARARPGTGQKLEDETSPAAPKAKPAASTGVTIKDFDFGPATVTVNVGDTVTWTNQGPTGHSATANDGAFDTGILDAGQSASHTFDTAGTFAYICTPHPFMKGTVVVQAASTHGGASGDTTAGLGAPTAGTDSSASDDGPSLPSTGMDVLALGLLGLLMLGVGVARAAPLGCEARSPPAVSAGERLAQDSRGRGEARPGRTRPRREDHRPRPARRGHGGHLHGPPPDPRADRGDGDPGGRRRRGSVHPLGRPHDARPRIAAKLKEAGADDVVLVVGGTIPARTSPS